MSQNNGPPSSFRFQVNGLGFHEYKSCRGRVRLLDGVVLERQPSNAYDSNAIAVLWGGRQIGWMPKAINTGPAAAMDAGWTPVAEIVRTYQHTSRSDWDQIDVNVTWSAEKKTAENLYSVPEWAYSGSARFPSGVDGLLLGLRSSEHRTSASLTLDGKDVAWFTKRDIPAAVGRHINNGTAQAVLRSKGLSTWIEIYGPGILPDPKFKIEQALETPVTFLRYYDISNASTPLTKKENTMNNAITSIINKNKAAAQDAAVLEAGRIANNTIIKLVKPHTPLMARSIIGTPLGKLLVANAAMVAAQQLKGDDATLKALTEAMATAAFQEIYQEIDIEGILAGLMNEPNIKRAVAKLDKKSEA